jgi:tetratricopeptide (TPR) repeat protein
VDIAHLLARVAGRCDVPPAALAAMMVDWARGSFPAPVTEALLERKCGDFSKLIVRLALPIGQDEIMQFRTAAATAITAGRLGEADKALAHAELHAIDGATDLSVLPLERRLLIGENRADRAALSFLRTSTEAYREAAARYGEASALIGQADSARSKAAALDQARSLARLSEDFGGREGYDGAVAALRRLLEQLSALTDTVTYAGTQEALAAALEGLFGLTGEGKLREQALQHSRAGLDYLRPEEAPALWRALKLRFGRLAATLGIVQKDDNLLEEAIASYAGLLAIWSRTDDETRWLEAEHMISRARATLGKRRIDLALLERAFNGLNRVSHAIDRSREPLRWAELQDQMGGVLASMGERYSEPVVLEEAITAFSQALEERQRDRVPLAWARSRANQAEAMLQLARRTKNRELAHKALGQMVEAVEVGCQAEPRAAADFQTRLAEAGALAQRLTEG